VVSSAWLMAGLRGGWESETLGTEGTIQKDAQVYRWSKA
jgi:hypothetical protein